MKTASSKSKKTTPAPVAVKPPAAKAPVPSLPTRVTAPTPVAAPARMNTVPAAAAKTAAPAPASSREITSECIASRAYSLWEQQGRPQGRDLELWLQAEKQLKASQSFAA
jgi:hypothetical protein